MGKKAGLPVKKSESHAKVNTREKSGRNFSQKMNINSPLKQILHLQRTIGNQEVTRLIQSGVLQTKLQNEVITDDNRPGYIEASIKNSRGKGRPLPSLLMATMNSRMGYDFSSVRIHTDKEANQLSHYLQAQAFTHNDDIYFNRNYYRPETSEGKKLIVHELVHTIQQNRGDIKKLPTHKKSNANCNVCPGNVEFSIQKTALTALYRPSGTKIHNDVLKAFGSANKTLFTEVKIPGAKAYVVEEGKAGVADFYKAKTTIAVNFQAGQPVYQGPDNKVRKGSSSWKKMHLNNGAPLGSHSKTNTCDPKNPRHKICKINQAPRRILIGDLKPADSGEKILGEGQLRDYEQGLVNTAASVDQYAKNNPGKVPTGSKPWNLNSTSILRMGSLTIPSQYAFKTATTTICPIIPFGAPKDLIPGLKGRMIVYKDRNPGIWVYEWYPTQMPTTLSPDRDAKWKAINSRLIKLTSKLQKKEITGSPPLHSYKSHTGGNNGKTLQRKLLPFDIKRWQTEYKPWKKDAGRFLKSKEGKKASLGQDLFKAKKRIESRSSNRVKFPTIPKPLETGAKSYAAIKRWQKFGGVYARMRKAFGGFYLKITGAYNKMKIKFQTILNKRQKSGLGVGGGLLGTIAKTVFGIVMMVGTKILKDVLALLKTSFINGAKTAIKEYFSDDLEKAEKNHQEILAIKNDITTRFRGTAESISQKFIKPYKKTFEYINKIYSVVSTITEIINIARWVYRVIACLSPPAIGCLWIAVEFVADKILSRLARSCMFKRKIAPYIAKLNFFKNMSVNLADTLRNTMLGMLPKSLRRFFAPITAPPMPSMSNLSCKSSLSAAQKAMILMQQRLGEDRVKALQKLFAKAGVPSNIPFNSTIAQSIIKDVLKTNVKASELNQFADNYQAAPGAKLVTLKKLLEQARTSNTTPASTPIIKPEADVKKQRVTPNLRKEYRTARKYLLRYGKRISSTKKLMVYFPRIDKKKLMQEISKGNAPVYWGVVVRILFGRKTCATGNVRIKAFNEKANKMTIIIDAPKRYYDIKGNYAGPTTNDETVVDMKIR